MGATYHRDDTNPRIAKQAQINVAMALAIGGEEAARLVPVCLFVVKSMPKEVFNRLVKTQYTSYTQLRNRSIHWWDRPPAGLQPVISNATGWKPMSKTGH